jgi:hypothetical protein
MISRAGQIACSKVENDGGVTIRDNAVGFRNFGHSVPKGTNHILIEMMMASVRDRGYATTEWTKGNPKRS